MTAQNIADDLSGTAKKLTLETRALVDLGEVAPTLGNVTVVLEELHQVLGQLAMALGQQEPSGDEVEAVQTAVKSLEASRARIWSAIEPAMEAQAAANSVVWPRP